MRVVAVLLLSAAMLGCSTTSKLERLEAEAVRTGDWSQVEKYQLILAKYERGNGLNCPDGSSRVCMKQTGREACHCASRASVNRELYGSIF